METKARCATAPASSANLGPGFDALGLALGLYVRVCVSPAAEFSLASSGEGSELPTNRSHLAARVVIEVLGHDRVAISVHSQIPLARGLGSSAALALAAAAAAGSEDPLGVAVGHEGHPENAAASFAGGLVAAAMVDDRPIARPLPLDERLGFVVMVPEAELSTSEARSALSAQVPHSDAAFNLGRMGLLVSGLGRREDLVPQAFEDRLHQSQRSKLFPEATRLIEAIVDQGAYGACWSGAGTTILAVCRVEDAAILAAKANQVMVHLGVAGQAMHLQADRSGLMVGDGPAPWL